MYGGVLGVGDPGLLVHHRQPPDPTTLAREMIKPRHRAIVDVEAEPLLHQAAERQPDRSLDGAAMADRYHVAPGMGDGQAINRALGAAVEIHKTFAAWRRHVDLGKPAAARRTACDECGAVHALPLPEMLLGESGFVRHLGWLRKASRPDRLRGLVRAHQIARNPDRIARQYLGDRIKYFSIGGVAGDVGLAVN